MLNCSVTDAVTGRIIEDLLAALKLLGIIHISNLKYVQALVATLPVLACSVLCPNNVTLTYNSSKTEKGGEGA
jgi:hypothetical protein